MTYPTILPKLTLDFANSRQLDPRITFSRSSSATYVHPDTGLITSAPDGVARFEKEGLLIEESRTNLLTYSEEFDDASWIKANVSITANSTTAPDGTSTADTLNCSSGGQTFQHTRKVATTTAASYTFSCFVKAGNISTIRLGGESYAIYATFDLTGDGSYSSVTTGASASIVSFPNGWYRCTLTYTASAGTYVNDIRFSSAALNDYVYIWGAQLEQGSFPTSYIPTSGSTATRSADVASMTGTNFSSWYNQSEGSFSLIAPTLKKTLANQRVVYTTSSSPTEGVQFWNSSGIATRYRVYKAGSVEVDISTSTYEGANWGWVYKVNDAALFKNGVLLASDTSCAMPTAATSLSIGANGIKHLSRLTYYDRRLTDAQLQALTL